MKAHIIPTVFEVNENNLADLTHQAIKELNRYDVYPVGKTDVSTCPICFDTETTTVTEDGEQFAFIWIYQIQIGKYTLLISDRLHLLRILKAVNDWGEDNKSNIYIAIANTKYEWSFLCKDISELIEGEQAETDILFGLLEPLAVNVGRLIICDIVRMANSSLVKIGADYCTTQKLKGDLDYSKIRNSKTIKHLTPQEKAYCINDVVVGAEYMTFIHNRYTSNYKRIPLTSTAFIRQLMQDSAYEMDASGEFIHKDTLKEILHGFPTLYKEYDKLMNFLFRGGYTHGNLFYCAETLTDIEHIDYTSDYPAVLLQLKYPYAFYDNRQSFEYMGYTLTVRDFENEQAILKLLNFQEDLAFYFTATFENIKKITPHTLESTHKIIELSEGATIDNGRVAKADKMTVMLTEQDLICYRKLYTWENMAIEDLHIGIKKPLPEYMINAIVTAYTEKKRKKDLGLPYAVEKALLNSVFGCTCQRIQIEDERDVITSDNIVHINSPVKFDYLNTDTRRNVQYFLYVKEGLMKKYHWDDTQMLTDIIKRIYADLYDGTEPDTHDSVYMKVYQMVIEKLQQRAYYEEKRGKLTKNRQTKSKMLSPYFGIWCTAYARCRLITMISELETFQADNPDIAPLPIVVYYDTDSLFLNCHQSPECWKAVKAIIDKYNTETKKYNTTNLRQYDNSGLLDDLGLFDWETKATHFKQLGAKRYLQRYRAKVKRRRYAIKSISKTEHSMIIHTKKIYYKPRYIIEATVAGLNKNDFTKKVKKKTVKETFDFFTHGMFLDELETNKLIPSIIPHPYSCTVTDDFGNTEIMHERCGQVLKHTSFRMVMTGALLDKLHRVG